MKSYRRLLLANRAWAQERLDLRPDYFEHLAAGQAPEFLWIGCSDSRVPPDEITGTGPGEVFVHRNIANLVVASDLNLLSVLQYAVENLGVRHVIVCGHYGCGGVTAAMGEARLGGVLDEWLGNIKRVHADHRAELDLDPDFEHRRDRLVELNVLAQVDHLVHTSIIQGSWAAHRRPVVHGWVFGLHDGLLHALARVEPPPVADLVQA